MNLILLVYLQTTRHRAALLLRWMLPVVNRLRSLFLLITVILGSVTALGATEDFPYTFTDAVGREITIEKPLTRVISLNRQTSECLVAIGAGETILATGDETVRYNPFLDLGHLPKLGITGSESIEFILSLNPEVVFAYSIRSRQIETRLEGTGIQVIRLDNNTPYTEDRELLVLGRLMGKMEEAQNLVKWKQDLRKLAADRVATIAEGNRKSVAALYLSALTTRGALRLVPVFDEVGNPAWGESYLSVLAGGTDAFPTIIKGLGSLSRTIHLNEEYMLQYNPTVITFHGRVYGGYTVPSAAEIQNVFDQIKKTSSIRLTDAGKNGKFYFFHNDLTGGNKKEIGVLQLIKYLYPEIMTDLEPIDLLHHYFDTWMPKPFQGTWFYADGDL